MKKIILFKVVQILQPAVRGLQLRTFFIIFLFSFVNSLHAQYWHFYNPMGPYDVNTVEILGPGTIVIGGGKEANDSTQVMFQTTDYGLTWYENNHDGLAPWNKSIAFSDALNGYGVGYDGRIIKSADAGMNWGYPATPIIRDFNKIVYVGNGVYYVAGGNKTNDSMQTILKSTNYGNTWNVIYDVLGPCLKSICFINTQKGFAVGDNGVLIATTNGGNSWAPVTAPIIRDFNAITFINGGTGFIVGGTASGLSRKTILKTMDYGVNWSVLIDNTGGILKDISFADTLVGYVVGDSATVLKTIDGGLNWLPIVIDANLTGNESFNAVKFQNQNFGAIGGKSGELYIYYCPFPMVATKAATEININANSVRLNGSIDAGGYPTAVKFEYGYTTAYGNEISAIPDSSSNIGSIDAYAMLTGLMPNTIYHFRIKGSTGVVTNYGNDMFFYTGYPEIPNFDFEMWTLHPSAKPTGWDATLGIVTQYSPACAHTYAVKIMNDTIAEGMIGGILIGSTNDQGHNFIGGTPFNARPDTLFGCFNYAIPSNDTALIIVKLKKQGVFISDNCFKIYGNSFGNYTDLKFPIQYASGGNADSLIIVFTVTDIRHLSNQLTIGGYLIVDNVRFTGTSENIPNNDFENWEIDTLFSLNSWWYKHLAYLYFPVSRTTDVQHGNYAVLIQNYLNLTDTTTGELSTGDPQLLAPDFSVIARHLTLTGYYKFLPENHDTLRIEVLMFKNNAWIGSSYFYSSDTVLNYTPFVINIDYNNNNTIIPDSCKINIQSYVHRPMGNSKLYIDNLNFDGFLAGIKEPPLTTTGNFYFNIYPNPFNEQATVSFMTNKDEYVKVRLFDLSGKQVALLANGKYTAGNHKIDLSAEGLQKGFYICVINTEKAVYSKKLIVF